MLQQLDRYGILLQDGLTCRYLTAKDVGALLEDIGSVGTGLLQRVGVVVRFSGCRLLIPVVAWWPSQFVGCRGPRHHTYMAVWRNGSARVLRATNRTIPSAVAGPKVTLRCRCSLRCRCDVVPGPTDCRLLGTIKLAPLMKNLRPTCLWRSCLLTHTLRCAGCLRLPAFKLHASTSDMCARVRVLGDAVCNSALVLLDHSAVTVCCSRKTRTGDVSCVVSFQLSARSHGLVCTFQADSSVFASFGVEGPSTTQPSLAALLKSKVDEARLEFAMGCDGNVYLLRCWCVTPRAIDEHGYDNVTFDVIVLPCYLSSLLQAAAVRPCGTRVHPEHHDARIQCCVA